MDHIGQQISDNVSLVHLRLRPVGARISLQSSQQLRDLVNSLLATLAPVHAAGFVHRDICLDNILLLSQRQQASGPVATVVSPLFIVSRVKEAVQLQFCVRAHLDPQT